MTLQEAYLLLKKRLGSHRAAARHLKMTEQHYNAIRNGRANVPLWREDQILLKASELDPCPPPASVEADHGARP